MQWPFSSNGWIRGLAPAGSTSDQLSEFRRVAINWKKIVRESGARVE